MLLLLALLHSLLLLLVLSLHILELPLLLVLHLLPALVVRSLLICTLTLLRLLLLYALPLLVLLPVQIVELLTMLLLDLRIAIWRRICRPSRRRPIVSLIVGWSVVVRWRVRLCIRRWSVRPLGIGRRIGPLRIRICRTC
jgi:hypothetical protein